MPYVRIILPLCLFLSGFCALAYQIAWARYLSMFLGATAPAYTIVLATFMGGLAGGAWLFGKKSDRTQRPLRMYARLELWVALICFLFPWIIDIVGSLYMAAAAPLLEQPLPRNILRFTMAIIVLLIPSLLMGGTLPAATRFYVRAIDKVGEGVGRLYFVNALGAVAGSLIAGFILIPSVGLKATFWIAAGINAAIGLWALHVSKKIDGPSACPAPGWEAALEEIEDKPLPRESPFPLWVAIIALSAAGASGAASMIYEVSWIRLLTLVLGGSTYAFTIMVSAFILGIAIGAAIVSWWKPLSRGGLAAFGWLEIAIAFAVLLMVPLYNRLSYIYLEASAKIPREDENYWLFLLVGFLVCLGVMIIPTTMLGATFPLAARLSTRSIDSLGMGVGRAYAFDTGGTILGTVAAGHFLFPLIGLYGTFAVAAGLNVIAGIACLWGAMKYATEKKERENSLFSKPVFRGSLYAGLALIFFSFIILSVRGPRIDEKIYARGMFRSRTADFVDFAQFRSWLTSGVDLIFYKDGPEGSVSVMEISGQHVLNVNGKPEASSVGDMPTQLCVAHLPVLLHPEPERAILIGLGGGATAGALLTHTEMKTTVVELSPQVVEANRHFSDFNRNVLENPDLDLVVEDAKAYLGLTRERFDVIVSQPSNPWVAGNANLFTLEFFELLKSRLSAGGVMAQWFHDYEMTDDAVKTILHTFSSVFPYANLFHCGDGRDYVIIGTTEPLEPDIDRIHHAIGNNWDASMDLARYLDITSHVGILARQVLDDDGVRQLAEGGILHRDHRPVLDFQAPRGVFLGSMSQLIITSDQRWNPPEESSLIINRVLEGGLQTDAEYEEAVDAAMSPFGQYQRHLLGRWVDETGSTVARRRFASELGWVGLDKEALEIWREIDESGESTIDDRIERWNLEALIAYRENRDKDLSEAFRQFEELVEKSDLAIDYDLLAETAEMLDRFEIAARAWSGAVERTTDEDNWKLLSRLVGLARAKRNTGRIDEAKEIIEEAKTIREDYWPLIHEAGYYDAWKK